MTIEIDQSGKIEQTEKYKPIIEFKSIGKSSNADFFTQEVGKKKPIKLEGCLSIPIS